MISEFPNDLIQIQVKGSKVLLGARVIIEGVVERVLSDSRGGFREEWSPFPDLPLHAIHIAEEGLKIETNSAPEYCDELN